MKPLNLESAATAGLCKRLLLREAPRGFAVASLYLSGLTPRSGLTSLSFVDSVISKVVPAPEAKPAPSLNRPKTPPPAPVPAPVPMHVSPAPVPLPLLAQCSAPPAGLPAPPPAAAAAASAKAPVRSVVTETVSTYVVRAFLALAYCRKGLKGPVLPGKWFQLKSSVRCVVMGVQRQFCAAGKVFSSSRLNRAACRCSLIGLHK